MPGQQLGDKGLSILTFAAYHQLTSGEQVSEVVLQDGAGHAADPQGIREVEALGLAEIVDGRAILTDSGRTLVERLLEQIRGLAKHAEQRTAVA